ncbi:hypothetical protein OHA37_38015 [Streptomyces sp. NBC_00335]|uniref:hypothetical protein n=1 Tax=unclassified Streptomyces TaxID=2593676 RepID=UPI00225BDF0F|nr:MULTISPECIES: hypothetical protein [unclassified Streptomyces]MCX5409642.1 hypothetical protein [Streptomyces sp. NBC_00086]
MDLILDPPNGVHPLRFGMTFDEAMAAAVPWGEPRTIGPRPGRPTRRAVGSFDGVGYTAFFDEDGRLHAIELWRPAEGKSTRTRLPRVLFDGHDVFAEPAEEILRQVRGRGWTVTAPDTESLIVPGISLGFTRQTSQEVPRDADGLPLSFTSVLVAGADYYGFLTAP